KARKKPGRKPNPASPAVRKEQNRAAQRAFRDRKERHLQEMESTIKELKETNNDITQEARRLKNANELLQSENFYLREVVFSFETALSKGGHVAPSPRSFLDAYHARLARSSSPFSPITIPRSVMSGQDTEMATRVTEYTKQPTMFDELQSSLFPPGTLQSLIHNNLSTPQEIVNDVPLLDQLDSSAPSKDPVISSGYQAFPFSLSLMDSPLPNEPSSILDDDNGEYRLSTPTLGLDDGLKQDVIPSKRLQLEIRVLASAPPAVDPNIDVKVYSLPHDPRIDLIPCPRLRAQMILHQNKYDIEDLCQLLINEAICHGHPLDPHSWELPERFFDRYGFLLGQEMLRHRNKIWPKKDEHLAGTLPLFTRHGYLY
ncbi:MAG: hypothetical protein JOS17DRAFT_685442, partial [Linnemannia elongata]